METHTLKEALTEKIQGGVKWKLELFPPEATIQHL